VVIDRAWTGTFREYVDDRTCRTDINERRSGGPAAQSQESATTPLVANAQDGARD
jgi:hypothetical protein